MLNQEFKDRFIKARRRFIELDFKNLNDMQLKAVMATEGPLLLLAGAGSGKTTVLINRVANILKYGRASDSTDVPEEITEADVCFLEDYLQAPDPDYKESLEAIISLEKAQPWQVLAITFTNKAANELKERLVNSIGPAAGDIWAMTFHSACVRILRRDIDKIGFSSSFTIYDTSDSVTMMKRIMKDLNISDRAFQPRYILSCISKAKDSLITPDDFMAQAEMSYDPSKKVVAQAYLEYSKRLKAANALDFDDLIYYTVLLLRGNKDVREYYQKKFKYILVDEYQDTNNLQYLLVSTLAGGYENICVVGDDDQSIYKFRGATIKNILDFENQYKNARTIRLEQNYRSTTNILEAANDVIRNNSGRKGKRLWTSKPGGDLIMLHRAQSEEDEAQYVAEQIILGTAAGANWRDYAVLYRINTLSKGLEYAFKKNGIPYKIYGGTGFFDRAEVKDMLSYLCLIANTGDDLRLTRIINVPARGIGATTVEKIRNAAGASGTSMFDVMKKSEEIPGLSRVSAKLKPFTQMIESLGEAASSMPLDLLYDLLLDASGYMRMLESSSDPQDETRRENVLELKSSIISYMQSTEEPTLDGFLSEIALYTDLDTMENEDNCVSLMTIHSAKGLEFDNVFIVGAEDGIFPSIRSIGEMEEMEEERRLCYVAITRAREHLTFTCSARRMLHGKTSANQVSRFIDEISSEHINRPPETIRSPYGPTYGVSREEHLLDSAGYSDYNDYYERRRNIYYNDPAIKRSYEPKKKRPVSSSISQSPSNQPLPDFKEGDRITHTAFGAGTIISVKPVGNDALIKVDFDSVGSKQLMLKTASKYMKYQ